MPKLTLVIGDKNYSSWSLRPWLVMTAHGIPFDEEKIRLRRPETKADILAHTPSGQVPVLKADDLLVWDSLAICEWLAEAHPDLELWPADPGARARARSIAAEMHGGFGPLRRQLPMDFISSIECPALEEGTDANIRRVVALWEDCLRVKTAGSGPFLFGSFTIADAMYAPVVSRFTTYGIAPSSFGGGAKSRDYMDAVWALPAMDIWREGAEAEIAERGPAAPPAG